LFESRDKTLNFFLEVTKHRATGDYWMRDTTNRDAPISIFAADTEYRFLVMVIGRYRCLIDLI